MSRWASRFVLLMFLCSVLTVSLNIRTVEAEDTIYIREDGRVEGTDKISRDGDVYVFTGDISGAIFLEKGGVVVDGNGYTLVGNGSNHGFYLSHVNDTTVKNVKVENCDRGFYLSESFNNTVKGNTVTGNNRGIVSSYSGNTLITENNVLNNDQVGINIFHSENDTITQNTVTDNGGHGILLNPTTEGCYVAENEILNSGGNGIALGWATTNNAVTENKIKNSGENGIRLYESRNNLISKNNIHDNEANGIYQTRYCSSVIVLNNITSNSDYGIHNNQYTISLIHHNNFINNGHPARNHPGENHTWDNGYPSGGNYWSNYNGTDQDGDGVGDTPYVIDENNTDNHPLMAPVTFFDAGTWEGTYWAEEAVMPFEYVTFFDTWKGTSYHVFVVSNSTVSDFTFDPEDALVHFNVEGESGTSGFCRVTVPKELLYAEENSWIVRVDEGSVTPKIQEGQDNTYLYFTYSHGSTKTVEIQGTDAIPEFPSLIAVLFGFAMVTLTLLVALIYGRNKNRCFEGFRRWVSGGCPFQ